MCESYLRMMPSRICELIFLRGAYLGSKSTTPTLKWGGYQVCPISSFRF